MRQTISVFFFLFSLISAFGQTKSPLIITLLTGDFYVYTTFNTYKGSRIPANGTYLVTHAGVVLFDTPWDTSQFQPLIDSIRIKHNKEIVLCLATHFHEDRTAGLEFYRRRGVKTYTTRQTDELSKASGKSRAEFLITQDTTFTVGQYAFQTYFPGHGHTADNIVIWFEKEKILHGGCLIKSTSDHDLGNLADADTVQYAATVYNVIKKCKHPKFVVPGHDSWASTESLNHTLKMAQALKKKH
jgi:metallo-beta-lactamase class B